MMRWLKRLFWLAVLLMLTAGGLVLLLPRLNAFQRDGGLAIEGLRAPVTVSRDEKGMAYIQAGDLEDALLAQGFVTAQDRLFQMQLTKLFIQGRLGEFLGPKARASDLRMRTLGFARLAERHAAILSPRTRAFFERYAQGVNAFMKARPQDLHLEFRLAGVRPEPWGIADSLAVLYYMGHSTSANLRHEVVAQMLLERLGPERAALLAPLNVNPDDPGPRALAAPAAPVHRLGLGPDGWAGLLALGGSPALAIGSNNWVSGPALSAGGRPIMASDPHLDARILPGQWYPLGLVLPDLRAVGANIPGLPGMALGRTSFIAISMTNNYGDTQDLYLETPDPADPGRYLEGGVSRPYDTREETFLFRDKEAPGGARRETALVRATTRGPVVSGLIPGLPSGRVVSLRWSPAETMSPTVGLEDILTARSARELDQALTRVTILCLNWVFADHQGEIGWRVSGRLPLRAGRDGSRPATTTAGDDWTGYIPPELMPHALNPERGWLGTCNHYVVGPDYPHYYSSYAASGYRYRRLKELMAGPAPRAPRDFWGYQRDVKNLLAEDVAPIMAKALQADPATRDLGDILAAWDHTDEAGQAAPAIFQATWLEFARQLVEPALGRDLVWFYLDDLYYWQERVQSLAHQETLPSLDGRTAGTGRDELMRRAARAARGELASRLGGDPRAWRWGELHTLELVSPLRREGAGKALLGSGPMPISGSSEALLRGRNVPSKGFAVNEFASLRWVADLGDPDKVLAVLPGGVCGRAFSPHEQDQVRAYMDGTPLYWWFSDQAIADHVRHKLSLEPAR